MPFSPSDFFAWWEADLITGLSDGDAIPTLIDGSPNGRNVTQSDTARRATWQTNELNGLPVMRFDGSNDYYRYTAATPGAQPNTLVALMKVTGGAGTTRTCIGSAQAAAHHSLFCENNNTYRIYAGAGLANGTVDASWHLLVGVFNGTSSKLIRDGTAASGNAGGEAMGGGIGVSGADETGLFAFNGDMALVGVIDGLASDARINEIGNYTETKYGIAWADLSIPKRAVSHRRLSQAVKRAAVI